MLKGGVLCAAAVGVVLPEFLSSANGADPSRAMLLNEAFAFFALTGLAVLMFPRAKLRDVAAGAATLIAAVEVARLTPALHLTPEPAVMLARIAGSVAVLTIVLIGRGARVSRRGDCPSSLAYLP